MNDNSILLEIEVLGIAAFVLILLVCFKRYVDGPVYKVPSINLKGKNVIVTGGSTGIGFETAKELALLGSNVIIAARNKQIAEDSIKQIKAIDNKASVEFMSLDLADRSSIAEFASSLKLERIDFLVNNAGVMGIPSRKLTKEGLEMHWAINHLGHFYLTYLLWPKITRSDFFRIINVSSRGHRWYLGFFKAIQPDFDNINFEIDYDPQMAYSRSKLYNVLFTRALAAKINPKKGLVASLHPGVVRTEILREMTADGLKGVFFENVLRLVWPLWWLFSKSARQGASTTLYTLLSD